MLKEKIFNFLAKNIFGLDYSYSEAKTYNQNKVLENKEIQNSIMNFVNKENFRNGAIFASGTLKILKKDGNWDYYFKNTNIPHKIIFHKENEHSFEKEEFYKTGELFKKNIRTHLKENITEKFFKSGEIKSIKISPSYFESTLDDYYEYTFYINGQLKEKKRVYKGNIVGLYEEYSEDGILKQKYFSLINGEKEGVYEEYYENGCIKKLIDYKNGKKEGLEKTYYKNLQVKEISLFNEDRLVQILAKYDEKGNSN